MKLFSKLKISLYQKLTILVFIICSLAILVFGSFTFVQYYKDTENEKTAFLQNLRDSQHETLTNYFLGLEKTILFYSQSLNTRIAFEELSTDFKNIKINEFQRDDLERNLKFFYENSYKFKVSPEFQNQDKSFLDSFLKSKLQFSKGNDQVLFLQNTFLNNPEHPVGFKENINSVNDGSRYSYVSHPKYHAYFKDFKDTYEFYDVFMVHKDNAKIIYSVFKETDFATSLEKGPYKNTEFGKIVRRVIEEYELNAFKEPQVYFTDFERYSPSYFAPAAFIAAPIFDTDEDFQGVFVIQIKADNLNRVLANNYQWKKIGLGLTGNSYLVGKDKKLRSDLRLYIQDKTKFFDLIKSQNDKLTYDKLKNVTTSNLLVSIDNEAIQKAFSKEQGLIKTKNIEGKDAFTAYSLFAFKGLEYALITEMETEELFSGIRTLFITMSSGVLVSLILAFALCTYLILALLNPLKSLIEVSDRVRLGFYSERASVETRDEIGELSRSFNSMVNSIEKDIFRKEKDRQELAALKEEADGANEAKSSFLANMSHELRTPMNAIIGYSEILMEDAVDNSHDEYVGDLKKINTAGKHLLTLINDILDISKIEAGKMELDIQDLNLETLFNEVFDTTENLIQKNNNQCTIEKLDGNPAIVGDSVKIKQILLNLISNAAKFTENGHIFIGYKENEKSKNFIDLYVRDTGIGIDKDKINRVFEEFGQEDTSTTRKYGGTGLGLSLCKKFSELMGGTIRLESEKGVGSTFTVTIPKIVIKNEQLKQTIEQQEVEPGKKVILVVDDDPAARDLIKRILEKENYIVLTAASGDEAVEIANKKNPHLITLDIMMPQKSGWDTLKELRQTLKFRDTPVIMVSMLDDDNTGQILGSDHYLQKPVDREKLVDTVSLFKDKMKNNNMMIVDDIPDNREIVKRHLKDYNFNFYEAENGKDAIEKLLAKPCDGIILDLMMPVMDGFEFLTKIKEYDKLKNIPIIVLTAKDLNKEEVVDLKDSVSLVIQKSELSDKTIKELVNNLVLENKN
jgi:signal transduction histidine kinase/CheY-like chemotaxis protein